MTEAEKNSYQKTVNNILNIKFIARIFLLFVVLWGAIKFGNDGLAFISKLNGYSIEERQKIQSQLLPIYFELDSYTINSESLSRLERYIPMIISANPKSVLVEGHVVELAPAININMSERRAEEVKSYLVSHGVSDSIIRTVGMGATQPAPNKEPKSLYHARAEIKLSW